MWPYLSRLTCRKADNAKVADSLRHICVSRYESASQTVVFRDRFSERWQQDSNVRPLSAQEKRKIENRQRKLGIERKGVDWVSRGRFSFVFWLEKGGCEPSLHILPSLYRFRGDAAIILPPQPVNEIALPCWRRTT